jgi:hypothetical protein
MSTRSLYSLIKIYKHFLKDFELKKNKKMLPSTKFQNDAQIQDFCTKNHFLLAEPLNRNVVIFLYVLVLMIYKNKNNVAKLKNQNRGLIQDGDDFFFNYSHIKLRFCLCGLATLILIYNSIRTTIYQKMRTFHLAVVL